MTRPILYNTGPDALTIWSKRWSVAKSWHAQNERQCAPWSVEGWLAYFQKEEPDVEFVASKVKPLSFGKES